MKRILVAVAISGATLLAHATAPTPEAIEKLLVLTQAEKLLDGIVLVRVSRTATTD